MKIEESGKRQHVLEGYLYDMAFEMMNDEQIHDMAKNLRSVYTGGFRHSYSNFFPVIVEIAEDEKTYNLDYLANNLYSLRRLAEEEDGDEGSREENKHFSLSLTKLVDHLNLEIGRYNQNRISEQREKDLEQKSVTLQKQVSIANEKIEELNKIIAKEQKESIAILGIFAAVVLAFTGGLSYTKSVFEGISLVDPYRLAGITMIVGWVILNTLFGLFYYIDRLVNDKKGNMNPILAINIAFVLFFLLFLIYRKCMIVP